MYFADAEARKIFFAYALPCLEVRVSKGELSIKQAKNIIKSYSSGEELPARMEEYFVRAKERCSKTAEERGKTNIDAEVVRRCFRLEHDKYIDEEAKLNQIRNPNYCRVWPGIVVALKDHRHALVRTPKKDRIYRTEFVPNLQEMDLVAVHRDFVSEIITSEIKDKMLDVKKPYI